MRQGYKSDLLPCLESLAVKPNTEPITDVKIFNGAVQILDPKSGNTIVKTFSDYSKFIFIPYITRHLQSVSRVDIIWDIYKPDSLKSFVRQC